MLVFFGNYFVRQASIAALLASIVCGIVGTIIVEKKLVSMSGGIAHSSFGGIGLGYLLKFEPIIGGLGFSIIAAISIANIKRKTNTNADTLVGMFWSVGMALGILFVSMMKGYPPDLNSYLFGQILLVSTDYIKIMGFLTSVIVLVIICFYRYWKAFLFDEEFAKVIGLPVLIFEYTLYILIALSIVILIKVVGIILVIALLTVPPAISKLFTYKLSYMMLLSSLLGVLFSFGGLILSYYYDIPSGATIILLSVASYMCVMLIKTRKRF
ncbi:MAG: metal ABC transporter permease [Eubacteriales bacterium]